MKKVLFTATIQTVNTPIIEYSIVKSKTMNTDVYGAQIRVVSDWDTQAKIACVNDIFTDIEECKWFIALLAVNCVYPVHLHDIAEDFIGYIKREC